MTGSTLDLGNWLALSARVEPSSLSPGGQGRFVVEIIVPDGCHIESNRPSEPFLIPTVLHLDPVDGVRLGRFEYPRGEERRFDWTPVTLRVYRGAFALEGTVEVAGDARPGERRISGRLNYQGCTQSICLKPAEQALEAVLWISTA